MHTPGHIGIGLLVYLPIGVFTAVYYTPLLAMLGMIVALWAAMLPDVDVFTPFNHRGVTHSLLFIVLSSVVVTFGAGMLGILTGHGMLHSGLLCGGITAIVMGSHLLADSLTPMGIWPLWPLSGRHITFDLVSSAHPEINWALFTLGVLGTIGSLVVLFRTM